MDLRRGKFIPEVTLPNNEYKYPLLSLEEDIVKRACFFIQTFPLDGPKLHLVFFLLSICVSLATVEESTYFLSSPHLV